MTSIRSLAAITLILAVAAPPARAAITERVSVDSAGNEANDQSATAAISDDGRFVAFATGASNLDPDCPGGGAFVHDRDTGATECVSVNSLGVSGNVGSSHTSISGDGRFVTFRSDASNLTSGDTNGGEDIFIHDRVTHVTERVSVDPLGGGGGTVTGWGPVSDDGRFVAFMAAGGDLVAGDNNGTWDIFVRDRQTGVTSRVSVDSFGNEGDLPSDGPPAISGNGRVVAFSSRATNLVPNDDNGRRDVFVHDRQTGITSRVSVDSFGNEVPLGGEGSSLSDDGRFVAFESADDGLVPIDTNGHNIDVFVHDRQTGLTTVGSVDSFGNQSLSSQSYFSLDDAGRFLAFQSVDANLVPGDTNNSADVFVHDFQTGLTWRASLDSFGNEGNSDSVGPLHISGGANAVVFESTATNLVSADTNDLSDIFVHGMEPPADPDNDGVPDLVEDAAPNGGDGNDDGTPDSEQSNVTSLPNAVDDRYVTVASPPGTTLANVVAIQPSTLPPPPDGLSGMPLGVISFEVVDLPPNGAAVVEIFFPPATLFQSYYKYGAEPGDLADHWYEFLDDGTTGAVIGPDRITLTLVDGLRGDDDLTINGTIVDPGAPALLRFEFMGFVEPVDNPPVVNQVKAGRVVPVKFELGGDFGLAILEIGYPRSQAIACNSGAPLDTIEESSSSGSSGLHYDAATSQYVYTWKTDKTWVGTCRRFELKLNDGSPAHVALFKFLK